MNLKVDKNTFNIIVDKNQRIKGFKGIYYKISYVNKVIYDRPLVLLRSGDVGHKKLIKKKESYDYKQAA